VDAHLTIERGRLDAAGRPPRDAVLWPVLFAVPHSPPGITPALTGLVRPLVRAAAAPLVTRDGKEGVELVPARRGGTAVRVHAPVPLGDWYVGALALVVPGGVASTRAALDASLRRLEVLLAEAADARDAAPAEPRPNATRDRRLGDPFRPAGTAPAPRPAEASSVLARLARGPAHVVLADAVADPALRRHDALRTLRRLRTLRPDAQRPPGRPRPDELPPPGDAVAASLAIVRLVEAGTDESAVAVDGPLLDGRGGRAGLVEGTCTVGTAIGLAI